MRYIIMTCLLTALCVEGESARASSRALSGASAGIMVTATVSAPLGLFIDIDGALILEAPNNSGVFVEHCGHSNQAVAFVIMRSESIRVGFDPMIATKPVSHILGNAIFDYSASPSLTFNPIAEPIPILTIVYTEN